MLVLALSLGLPTVVVAQERAALLEGVGELVLPGGIPGDFVVFGDNATVVLTGASGKTALPMIVATHYGRGRAVALGHEGFFQRAALQNTDNLRLTRNLALWASQKPLAGVRTLLLNQDAALAEALTAAGCKVEMGSPDRLATLLPQTDILWLNQSSLDGEANRPVVETVRKWVQSGGGLVISGPAWGWVMTHEGRELTRDHSGNQLLAPMGIVFSNAMLEKTGKSGYLVSKSDTISELTQVPLALKALEAVGAGTRNLTPTELAQVTTTLGQAVEALPETQLDIVHRVEQICAQKGGDQIPTRQTPITTAMPFARLKVLLESRQWRRLPPEKIVAHPSAASFPGAVPADAKRETRTVTIDTSVPQWHGTGLYAAPGEVVTLTIPQSTVNRGLGVRIGSHTDTLWHLNKWERFPDISLYRKLDATTVRIASPFGGTLFIDVPQRARSRNAVAGEVTITVANAVAAPRFVRGITDNATWKRSIRSAPGPWAEMEGKRVILSVPSSAIRDLDDPEALMAYWDEVLDKCYALYAAPLRQRPERYCVDRQISAGYMHSGYPIMTGDDVAKTFCDLTILRGTTGIKTWGFYHEMGHNFQQPEWTWAPFGEVTNNLFSLYGTETLNSAKVGAHPAMTAAQIETRMKAVAAAPGKQPYYSSDPWYPLTMFWLIRQEFGWEPFTRLFAEFRQLPPNERPRSEREKHDQFLTRFSPLVGHDLSAYLTAWGIDTSPEARQKVANLPTWMPANWPK